jgi:hypothetical protein
MLCSLSPAHVNFGFSDLVVASPIEDHFIFIDELPDKEKVFSYEHSFQFKFLLLFFILKKAMLLLSIKLSHLRPS